MTVQEKKARDIIHRTSDSKLLALWDTTEATEISIELAMVRKWLMEEMEQRWPEAFNAWMESESFTDDIRDYLN